MSYLEGDSLLKEIEQSFEYEGAGNALKNSVDTNNSLVVDVDHIVEKSSSPDRQSKKSGVNTSIEK